MVHYYLMICKKPCLLTVIVYWKVLSFDLDFRLSGSSRLALWQNVLEPFVDTRGQARYKNYTTSTMANINFYEFLPKKSSSQKFYV